MIDNFWKVIGGIEWLKVKLADGNERRGYTWNVIGGCLHKCQWVMPNGNIAQCYAKTTAEGVAMKAYPNGFEHHYFHPDRLREPARVKVPSRFFPDSMADIMGHWVPVEEIKQVLKAMSTAHWHTYLLLTKNPIRYAQFIGHWDTHTWLGASTPPDYMYGNHLSDTQRAKLFIKTLEALDTLPGHLIKWLSVEPLSWDVTPILEEALKRNRNVVKWLVIGAASDGNKTYQPNQWHLNDLLALADRYNIPVFFKGNLDKGMVKTWREEFPHDDPLKMLAA